MSDLTSSVCDILIQGILSGEFQPGSKLLSEREFAEKNSVSRITVRRAFSRLEESGIIVRKRPKGTYIADVFHAHKRELDIVGLISNLSNEFSASFIEAAASCCEKEDILLTLGIPESNTLEAQLKIALRMVSRGVKNLIVCGAARTDNIQIFERLRILGVNMVFYDQVIPDAFADFIGVDNELAIETLVDAAVKKGKKKFLFLNYSDIDIDSCSEREQSFIAKAQQEKLDAAVCYLQYNAKNSEKRLCFEKLNNLMHDDCALIAVNAPILRDVFRESPDHGALFCVDYSPHLNEIGAVGYAQPIKAMAIEAMQMLRNQCLKGKKWRCVHRRFAGALIE